MKAIISSLIVGIVVFGLLVILPAVAATGPYSSTAANDAYWAVISCLESKTSNCISAVRGLDQATGTAVLNQAYSDWQSGNYKKYQTSTPTPTPTPTSTPTPKTTTPSTKTTTKPAKEAEPTEASEKATQTAWTGRGESINGLSRQFDAMIKEAKQISPGEVSDSTGTVTSADQFKNGLSEDMPEAKIPFPLKNIKAGEAIVETF